MGTLFLRGRAVVFPLFVLVILYLKKAVANYLPSFSFFEDTTYYREKINLSSILYGLKKDKAFN